MTGFRVEVHSVASDELAGPLALLEESLRGGEPVSSRFVEQLKKAVEKGEVEVLAAWAGSEVELVGSPRSPSGSASPLAPFSPASRRFM